MPKFRPFTEGSNYIVPDLTRLFVVTDGRIETHGMTVSTEPKGLQHIKPETEVGAPKNTSFINRLRRIGNVTVQNSGSSTTYENLKPASAFVAAVNAERSRIESRQKEQILLQSAWYRGKTLSDISDEVVVLPINIPLTLDHVYAGITGNLKGGNGTGVLDPNKWIDRDEIFYSSSTDVWKAPVRGLVLGGSRDFDAAAIAEMMNKHKIEDREFILFAPLKGLRTGFTAQDFAGLEKMHDAFKDYEEGRNPFSNKSIDTAAMKTQFALDVKAFRTQVLKKIPLSDVPAFGNNSKAFGVQLGHVPEIADPSP